MSKLKNLIIIEFVLILFIFPIFITNLGELNIRGINQSNSNQEQDNPYSIGKSVLYDVKINFSLTHLSGPNEYLFKFSRIDDRQANSPSCSTCPPYQQTNLLYNKIENSNEKPAVISDRFGNSYDLFNSTLGQNQKVSLNQHYQTRLNEISFQNLNHSLIGNYDYSSEIFELYCNESQPKFEIDNTTLIEASNNIIEPDDNIIEKAEKICDWVSSYLEYDDSLGAVEKGALWAYENKVGDCSEFSSLMVTLLRIQDIPSRKVTGYMVSNNPSYDPEVGKEHNFSIDSTMESSFLGHGWVEYYVPNIGWIACDPTFNKDYDYFNKIDCLRFNLNVGSWFIVPGIAPPNNKISEFSNPLIVYQNDASFDFEYSFTINVLDTDSVEVSGGSSNQELINLLIIGGVIVCLLGLVGVLIKKRNKY
jgi:hypothetical protein